MESVAALVDALKAYQGGVLLVTHDARLIQGLECELWVVGDGLEAAEPSRSVVSSPSWSTFLTFGGPCDRSRRSDSFLSFLDFLSSSGGSLSKAVAGKVGSGNASGGLRVERRGFKFYRSTLVRKIENRAAALEVPLTPQFASPRGSRSGR